MKTRITALLTLCFALLCGCALAFDLSPYVLSDGSAVCPVSRYIWVETVAGETAHRIIMHTFEGFINVGQRAADNDVLIPFATPGRTIGLFRTFRTGSEIGNGIDKQMLFWKYNNSFSDPIPLDEQLQSLRCAGEAVAGYHDGTLHLLDLHGRELGRVRVESDEEVSSYLHGIVADGDGFLAAVFAEDKRQGVNGVFIVSVGGDGRERWRSFLPVGLNNTYAALTGDGTGGAYFMKADDGDYKTGRMVAIDATGTPRWEKTVALDGLIMSSAILGWDGGAVTVDARGVSKSKGVYDVVHLRISPEGTLLSATARDFSCRPDYSFTLRRAAEDGAIFAESEAGYLDTKGTKHVLVPVDALPEIAAPNVIVK